ncbi:ATP-binding cassette domain-containing protein, partial [Microbacterium lacticum]|uniref:ATP-binding cassette domain-containing protein n=1 Tax=Microbacterium lacticum TaxID=33885 RepID=UPI001F55D3E1
MTAARTLRTEGPVSGYGRTTIVDGVDLQIPTGKVSVIVGANACGKSTLLKTIARLLPTQSG